MERPVRVQNLTESGVTDLPPSYVQPPELRPSPISNSCCQGIPIIDLHGFHHGDQFHGELLTEIHQACRDWGMFQVENHCVPSELMDRMKEIGLQFFHLPAEDKMRFACEDRGASEGYGSRMLTNDDSVLDWRDWFNHHTLPEHRRNLEQWPDYPPDYREVVAKYSDEMKLLAQRLLGLVSESLGLPSSSIQDAIGEPYQNITISYYPPCPQPHLALGFQGHSDFGAITLLIQDGVGGLQVHKDGQWITAQPLQNAIVVNLSDQTEIISNGLYKSANHRVIVNAKQARISVATFYDPSKTTKISPNPKLITENSPPRYREVLYGDYITTWYGKGPDGKRNLDALALTIA